MNPIAICMSLWATAAPFADAPTETWRQYADLDAAGWSSAKLAEARAVADAAGSASVFAIHDGVVVAAWGQVDRPLPVFSVRKGIYSTLYGTAVAGGEIDLDATLADLGIDDLQELTDVERSATVEHLLTARSGIYHPSAFEPSSMKRSRPERGSHGPGEHWFYNNWDFNVAAVVLEQATGSTIAELVRDRIAGPLQLQDYRADHVFEFYEPSHSRHPAAVMRLSARDLARIGLLYLRDGDWNGRQVLTPEWIEASFALASTFEGGGYGRMWWFYAGQPGAERITARHDAYMMRGSGGQAMVVAPSLDMVLVHQTDMENGVRRGTGDALRVFEAIVAARVEPGAHDGATTELRVEPLAGAMEAPPRPPLISPAPALAEALVGEYQINPRAMIKIHALEGRVFALPQGVPLAEVELFWSEAAGRLFSPAVDLSLEIVRDETGRITELAGRANGQEVRAPRIH
jgi:CubicO group peptidase (beta-lactamase class C family)